MLWKTSRQDFKFKIVYIVLFFYSQNRIVYEYIFILIRRYMTKHLKRLSKKTNVINLVPLRAVCRQVYYNLTTTV